MKCSSARQKLSPYFRWLAGLTAVAALAAACEAETQETDPTLEQVSTSSALTSPTSSSSPDVGHEGDGTFDQEELLPWQATAGEEVAPPACRVPLEDRGSAEIDSDGNLWLFAGMGLPTQVQLTAWVVDWTEPLFSETPTFIAQTESFVDTSIVPSDNLQVAELQVAANIVGPAGTSIESVQWAARLLRTSRQLQVWADDEGKARWTDVGDPINVQSLEDVSVVLRMLVDPGSESYGWLAVNVGSDADTFAVDASSLKPGVLPKPLLSDDEPEGWLPSWTIAAELSTDPKDDPCRVRRDERASIVYVLNHVGIVEGTTGTCPFESLPCVQDATGGLLPEIAPESFDEDADKVDMPAIQSVTEIDPQDGCARYSVEVLGPDEDLVVGVAGSDGIYIGDPISNGTGYVTVGVSGIEEVVLIGAGDLTPGSHHTGLDFEVVDRYPLTPPTVECWR